MYYIPAFDPCIPSCIHSLPIPIHTSIPYIRSNLRLINYPILHLNYQTTITDLIAYCLSHCSLIASNLYSQSIDLPILLTNSQGCFILLSFTLISLLFSSSPFIPFIQSVCIFIDLLLSHILHTSVCASSLSLGLYHRTTIFIVNLTPSTE